MKMTKMDLTNFKKDSLEMGFTDRQERHPGHRYQHMKRCKSNFQIDSDFFLITWSSSVSYVPFIRAVTHAFTACWGTGKSVSEATAAQGFAPSATAASI